MGLSAGFELKQAGGPDTGGRTEAAAGGGGRGRFRTPGTRMSRVYSCGNGTLSRVTHRVSMEVGSVTMFPGPAGYSVPVIQSN